MQFKSIDPKVKEIYYFNPSKVETEADVAQFNNLFWSSMKVFANQNIAIQQVRFC